MLSYVVGLITCLAMYLVGKKNKYGHLIMFLNEFLWAYLIITTPGVKGLMFVCVFAAAISFINFRKWSKDEQTIQKTKRVNKTRSS